MIYNTDLIFVILLNLPMLVLQSINTRIIGQELQPIQIVSPVFTAVLVLIKVTSFLVEYERPNKIEKGKPKKPFVAYVNGKPINIPKATNSQRPKIGLDDNINIKSL